MPTSYAMLYAAVQALTPSSKPLRTYSRQRTHSANDTEPTAKRRRITAGAAEPEAELHSSPLWLAASSPTRWKSPFGASSSCASAASTSDARTGSSPPVSPTTQSSPPAPPLRRAAVSLLKRKAEQARAPTAPLAERSDNAAPRAPPARPAKRMVQMQLDLGGNGRQTCSACGMDYIPSNGEDAALHRKFHVRRVGGVDVSRAFVDRAAAAAAETRVWSGADGSFIAAVGRSDAPALRNKAVEVLQLVNAELGAAPMAAQALWGPAHAHERRQSHGPAQSRKCARAAADGYKVFLYVRGSKCVGACVAERIREAFSVLDAGGDASSSSLSVGAAAAPAVLGVSRIWTSNVHRRAGIATALLDAARARFVYGMTVPKHSVAFSQPTESGARLARSWFGQDTGWLVYAG